MQRSKGLDMLIASLLLVTATGRVAQANVFASGLAAPLSWDFQQQGPLTINYRLNEPATEVRIEVFRTSQPTTVIATLVGTTSYGMNSAIWDGRRDAGGLAVSADDYQFRIIASHVRGHAQWEDITPEVHGDVISSTEFVAPQGVAAQTNQASPDFGCVFVNNSQPEPSSDSVLEASKQGVYVLTADLVWHGGTAASAYAAGKNDPANHWDSQDDWSPNKIKIGLHDSHTYIGDSGAYQRSDDLYVSSGTQGPTATPVLVVHGPNHGRVPAAISLGAGSEKVLYGIDRDHGGDAYPDFYRWDVGETAVNFTGQPVKVFDAKADANPTGMLLWSLRDFDLGTTGDHDAYFANRTYPPAEVRVFRLSLGGSKLIWSKTGLELHAMFPALGTHPYCCAIAVDENQDRLAVMMDGSATTDSGKVMVLRASDGEFLAGWQASPAGDAATKQGKCLDFDAAGNLLVGSLTDQRLRLWSPPDGPNSYTTTFAGTIEIQNAVVDEPPAIVSAVSRKSHGNAGDFDIPVGLDTTGTECRAGGVSRLIVLFDKDIQITGNPLLGSVVVTTEQGTAIAPTGLSAQESVLDIELPKTPSACELTVQFPGISSSEGVTCTAALLIPVLTGDVNQDTRVNVLDMAAIRIGLGQPVTAATFRADLNVDGRINVQDLAIARSMIGAE
ncbi:MAG TPA: dockerin type I repeat-containing protein [Phycisphaerae bacterium]|nr:dockerin type I repeat-containing protein [Phycisphaerae bacterium]HRY67083.1 dockerin type I repeat-containing protein [Phycisphaerae bacterium]HSA26548.1 dockerin type I repeat-containing protein [Phycisphaerae bacterium]